MHRTFLIPGYMMNHELASMKLHCQIHSSSSQTSLTGFNYDLTRPLVIFSWATWPIHETRDRQKNLLRKLFFETKLISCTDNWKDAFNVETDVLLISPLFWASKVLLTEQLIGWAGSSCILAVSVRILKFFDLRYLKFRFWIIAERNLTYKPLY